MGKDPCIGHNLCSGAVDHSGSRLVVLWMLAAVAGCSHGAAGGGADTVVDGLSGQDACCYDTNQDSRNSDNRNADDRVPWDLVEDADAPSSSGPVRGSCEPNQEQFPARPLVHEPATVPWLQVSGTDIVDDSGGPVTLRGFNFGSWLAVEAWISGVGEYADWELLAQLDAKAKELAISSLLEQAKATNALEWLVESKSHWTCIREWREYMLANSAGKQAERVQQLWDWFDAQPWMAEEESIWLYLEQRFGFARAEELREAYQANYITELDFQRLAEMGLNLVRLPIWYQTLETDFEGQNSYRTSGWAHLENALRWARKYGLYVIVDLHGAPGGQSTAIHQGLRQGSQLWSRPECVEQAARVWSALASYCQGDPHVMGYDLLNEPMTCPDKETYIAVHKKLYDAIRLEDERHIILFEDGFRPTNILASPSEMGMSNIVFQFHFYAWDVASTDEYMAGAKYAINRYFEMMEEYQCPFLAGEFSTSSGEPGEWTYEALDIVLMALNEHGVHWSIWTWKYKEDWNMWGLYKPKGGKVAIKMRDTSFEDIKTEFENLNSANYETFPMFEAIVRERANDPWMPQDGTPLP